ncbi:MAG: proline dehydrogenase family protein [Caldilineales bacterium]
MVSPLRQFFIALSKSPKMQEVIVGVPATRRMARRFIAGEQLSDAIQAIRATNATGMMATLDYLGEHVHNQAEAALNADEYIRALQAIREAGVDSNISIKLTAMGLAVDDDFCYRNVRRIVEAAAAFGNFVRIDMEDTPVTTRTLAIYRRLREEFPNAGVVIQAYLRRSENDIRELMNEGRAHLRLCKGAYDEPAALAFRDKAEVDASMVRLARLMLDSQPQFPGTYLALASHDHLIINQIKEYTRAQGIDNNRFEFQMLYGIRRDLQQQLADEGYRMRVYIPYGTRWYPYYMRRLAERPANVLFFARALVGS